MSLTRTQVEGIARLARLQITEAQMPVYVDRLSRIIDFVEQLAEARTDDVEPMAHPLAGQVQRLRLDEVEERTSTRNTNETQPASRRASTSYPRSSSRPRGADAHRGAPGKGTFSVSQAATTSCVIAGMKWSVPPFSARPHNTLRA